MAAKKTGKVSSGFLLAPVKASGTPAYDPAWVRSPGKKTGTLKVGKRVGLGAPKFTSASAKAATTVRYRWLKNGKQIAGATRSSLALAKALRGKKISVRVTFAARGYKPLLRTVSFGRVR